MFSLKKMMGVVAFAAMASMPAHALVLDTFEYDVDLVVDGDIPVAGVTVEYDEVTNTVPAGDVIYDLALNSDTNPFGDTSVNASVAAGLLSYQEDPSVDATLTLTYFDDGTDIGDDGAAPIDFTDGGTSSAFYFDIISADVGFEIEITVTDVFGETATGTLVIGSTISTPETVFLSFGSFTLSDPAFDFSLVVNVAAEIESPTGSDFILDEVGTVSEPSALAVLGLGLVALGLRRRKLV